MSSIKTIKLLLKRRKNRPEMKASFLFNILETIADNLLILLVPTSYRLLFNILETIADNLSVLIELTPI